MGIKERMMEEGKEIKMEKDGVIEGRIRIGREKWRIIGIYVKGSIDRYLRSMEKWMEEKREGEYVLAGGDFNARTGREGGAEKRREELTIKSREKRSRKSRDEKMNGEWRKLVEMIEERGWSI